MCAFGFFVEILRSIVTNCIQNDKQIVEMSSMLICELLTVDMYIQDDIASILKNRDIMQFLYRKDMCKTIAFIMQNTTHK